MRRKQIAVFLVLVFVIGVLPAFSFAEGKSMTLDLVIRDFKADGKLFEGAVGDVEKLVRPQLGKDRKPDFSDPLNPTWPISLWQKWGEQEPVTLHELQSFFQDVQNRNMSTGYQLKLLEDKDGYFSVDMRQMTNKVGFYPIDNRLFGNEGKEHNFYFTAEHHSNFIYTGNESFTIAGDDDIWVFVNGMLVADMGGVHSGSQKTVSVPELVKSGVLKIRTGDYVSLDFFYMDRQNSQSNLYIRTNIDLIKYKTSAWARSEVDMADSFDIVPPSLANADMTRYITREEFAELVARLYERTTNEIVFPLKPNPFIDTDNKDIIKAYTLGITAGTSSNKFSPKERISREQVATILSRTIRKMRPEIDYSTAGAPVFKDQSDISAWAADHVRFISKNEFMRGTDGKFMPKAVTAAQKASGYGNTTREQAVAMCYRIFVKYK